ncbi:MAG: hypothetical protein ACTSRS_12495 [Candidatus Helarchaeota archaeon]
MGRTVPSFRQALEEEIAMWHSFRQALRPNERAIFDKLMEKVRNYGDAGMLANRPVILDTILMALLLEQQKQIVHLQKQIEELQKSRI